jgi:hypothetical protein
MILLRGPPRKDSGSVGTTAALMQIKLSIAAFFVAVCFLFVIQF